MFIFVHLGLPAFLLGWFWFMKPKSKVGLLVSLLLSVSVVLFLFFWGQWPFIGGYYLRYVILILSLVIWIIKTFKSIQLLPFIKKSIFNYFKIGLLSLFAGIFVLLNVKVIAGMRIKENAVNIEFPLKSGKYYIALGGSNGVINNHYKAWTRAQQYAIDINKLEGLGTVASGIMTNDKDKHFIFSENVYSPFDGIVIESVNSVLDNETSSMKVKRKDGAGNYLILKNKEVLIHLVHLKYNSLLVEKGDTVKKGDLIAQVGNSGFSQEPHLHFQASIYNKDSILVGIPMRINRRFLVRNDIVNCK